MTTPVEGTSEGHRPDGHLARRGIEQPNRLIAEKLVGRVPELDLLVRLCSHSPSVALVEGEAGVGKSRLIKELLAHPSLRGRRTIVGQCHPLQEPFPLGPFIDALAKSAADLRAMELPPITGALRSLVPEIANRLPPELPSLGDPVMERHRLFRALQEFLEVLHPLVVIEDLHWADAVTREFVSFLMSECPSSVTMVVTYRREDLVGSPSLIASLARLDPAIAAAHINLPLLTQEEVRELASSILEAEEISDEFTVFLRECTAGLPFAVEEVLRLLQDRRDLIRRGPVWTRRSLDELQVPLAIREQIRERIEGLDPDAQLLIQGAAVIEVASTHTELKEVSKLDQQRMLAALIGLLELGLLQAKEDDRYSFRHTLARQAVYESIPLPLRRDLHLRTARCIEAKGDQLPVARLAHHFKQAGRPAEWLAYTQQAAAAAASRGDDARAARLLQDALSSPDLDDTTRVRMTLELARRALHGRTHAEAIDVVRSLLEREKVPPEVRGELRLLLGPLLQQSGDASKAHEELRCSLPDLEFEPALKMRATLALSHPWVLEGGVDEHLAYLAEATALGSRIDDDELRLALAGDRAMVLLSVGHRSAREAVTDFPQTFDSASEGRQWIRGCLNIAVSSLYLGYYDQAARFAANGLEASHRLHYPRQIEDLKTAQLLLDWVRGRWATIEETARSILESRSGKNASLEAGLVLGLLLLARGQLDEARPLIAGAAHGSGPSGSIPVMAMASTGLARLYLGTGDVQSARTESIAAYGVLASKGTWAWTADLAPLTVRSLLASKAATEAEDLVADLRKGLRNLDAPAASAGLHSCQAYLHEATGNAQEADRLFAKAHKQLRALGRVYEAAQSTEGRAHLHLVEGRDSGQRLAIKALEDFESLGAGWDEARVRRLIREHHVVLPHPWRGGRRGYGTELSPREQEVAELAAAGKTNREIAARLYLSESTVANHVSRILQKVGAKSRKDLLVQDSQT